MFSPRLFAIFALFAVSAAAPSTDKAVPLPVTTITETDFEEPFPWFFPFGVASLKNFFNPFLKLFPSFGDIGAKVSSDPNNFQVVINVKDYKKDNLKVKVKGDYIIVQGSQEAKHTEHDLFASQFFHTYSLPPNCSASAVTATLTSDQYLLLNAPIDAAAPAAAAADGDKKAPVDIDVPIVESGKPLERNETTTAAALPETTAKAATTPASTREEVTDKDNDIPHGPENEIQP